MRENYRLQRLFISGSLAKDVLISLETRQAHYLLHVLRMKAGQELLVFNGKDGEWRAAIFDIKKKTCTLKVEYKTREQESVPDVIYCFALLKQGRLDYMVQKAVELGVAALQPVITQHCQVVRLNEDRVQANAVEALEQCGGLALPHCPMAKNLSALLADWDGRPLFFCDEMAKTINPLVALEGRSRKACGVLVGPEGGFSAAERAFLCQHDFVFPLSLGPRILRADTAAVAALALIHACLGDW
ncbi:16S rRNA (uracil(1498)-N(3))-methyltransferase [Bartonella sp. DGB2]|uniref:16S rRNA (uracil(1498)-N(3))-methyltransferase n=1 Tax=Bartonella sp. DGB2 TaxID=3388426 RepID=UPI00398FE29E